MNDLHIVTVATKSEYYFPYLIDTVKKYNGNITVLGYGEEWKGFSWRYNLMINYLKTLNKNEIVCFVDGYDVICCRELTELKDIFLKLKKKYKCKIIVSNHKFKKNFPDKIINTLYFGTCNKNLINAGTYIGYSHDLLLIIENTYKLAINNVSDDQILITKYCNLKPEDFYIDIENEIFLVIDSPYKEIINDIIIENKKVECYNKKRPFFIHGPGSTYLDAILIKLGYKDVQVKKNLYNNYYKKILLYIHPNIYNFYNMYKNKNTNNYSNNKIIFLLIIILFISVLILLIYYIINNIKSIKLKINRNYKK
jgi:hypothetical protein